MDMPYGLTVRGIIKNEKYVGDVRFVCKNHIQKQKITAEEAFLYSCNAVFIDIGQKTEYNSIVITKFGEGGSSWKR